MTTQLTAANAAVQDKELADKLTMASPTKTPRRVLGEITPNARLTPKHHNTGAKGLSKTTPGASPLKAQFAIAASSDMPFKAENTMPSFRSSRKRPFSALGSHERHDGMRSPVKHAKDEMASRTVSPAVLHVDRDSGPITVIEVAEEDTETEQESQEAMECDMPHLELAMSTQGITGSFSSLIDYNPGNASDEDNVSTSTTRTEVPLPVTSRVEMLKLRLKMAMYKLNTNQTFVPFASLEMPNARARTLSLEETDDQDEEVDQAYPTSVRATRVEEKKEDLPSNIIIKGGAVGKLLQGPTLLPTSYSARFVEGQPQTPCASPQRPHDEQALTSSAVKGDAATGLLELMRAN